MKSFSIYEHSAIPCIAVVQNGWCWGGAFFSWIWAFINKLYVEGGIALGVGIVMSFILRMLPHTIVGLLISFLLQLAWLIASFVIFGSLGNQFIASSFSKKGYILKETIMAPSKEMAMMQYMNKKEGKTE